MLIDLLLVAALIDYSLSAAVEAFAAASTSDDRRYGYRRITALLRRECWRVNHKRVERPAYRAVDASSGLRVSPSSICRVECTAI